MKEGAGCVVRGSGLWGALSHRLHYWSMQLDYFLGTKIQYSNLLINIFFFSFFFSFFLFSFFCLFSFLNENCL